MYIDGAAERLRSWGHIVSEGKYARTSWGRFAADDQQRLEDLVDAFSAPEVDIVLCSRGGYGLQRIISNPLLTEAVVKARESGKMLVGFSDITCLHQLCYRHELVSMHGPMCKHLATLPEDSEMIRSWRQALSKSPIHYTLPAHPLQRIGTATGTLVGGNLSVLYGLQGTPLGLSSLPRVDGAILFIEDIAERHYHIDRMMNNLRMSGVLERIGGLIVGQFSDCDDDPGMKQSVQETILHATRDYPYPVIVDFPAGHIERNLPLLLGRRTTIEVTEHQATVFTA